MKAGGGVEKRTRKSEPMRLSVIIPTLNEAAYLPILLDALAA